MNYLTVEILRSFKLTCFCLRMSTTNDKASFRLYSNAMFIRILFSEFYCLCANKQEQYFATFLILKKRDGLVTSTSRWKNRHQSLKNRIAELPRTEIKNIFFCYSRYPALVLHVSAVSFVSQVQIRWRKAGTQGQMLHPCPLIGQWPADLASDWLRSCNHMMSLYPWLLLDIIFLGKDATKWKNLS